MRKKQTVCILTGAVLAAVLAGAAAPVQAAEGVQLNYWSMWEEDESQAEVLREAAQAYEDATGIHVNIKWKGRGIKNLIGPALDAGEEIDLFDDDYQRIAVQDKAFVADLTDMVRAADYESHVIPVLLEQVKQWGGERFQVMPYQPYITGVWYSKELWEEAGLTQEDIPGTWEELLDVCEKIKNSETGLSAMTCDEDAINLLYGFQLARYVGQEQVQELIDGASWTQVPQAAQAASDIQKLFIEGYMSGDTPAQDGEGQNKVGYGEAVMVLQASWIPNEVNQAAGTEVDWGFFPWPEVEGGVDGTEASMVGAQGFAVVEASELQQEAFDFALSVCTSEYDLKMADAANSIPADTNNEEWPVVIREAEPFFLNTTKVYAWAAGLEDNTDYKDQIQEELLRLVRAQETPEEFTQALAAGKV